MFVECTARVSLPLYLALAEDSASLSIRQQRLGIPEIWSVMLHRMVLWVSGKRVFHESVMNKHTSLFELSNAGVEAGEDRCYAAGSEGHVLLSRQPWK